jgi:hypothetical protein
MDISKVSKESSKLIDLVRKDRVSDIVKQLEELELTESETGMEFFVLVAEQINLRLKGAADSNLSFPEPLRDILYTMYKSILDAVNATLTFLKNFFNKFESTKNMTEIKNIGGKEFKVYVLYALGTLGSLVVLSFYKVVKANKSTDVEDTPEKMENSIKKICSAFNKSRYLFEVVKNIKEEDNVDQISENTAILVKKAAQVSTEVLNFVDPELDVSEDSSKLASLFKKVSEISALISVSASYVLIANQYFETLQKEIIPTGQPEIEPGLPDEPEPIQDEDEQ